MLRVLHLGQMTPAMRRVVLRIVSFAFACCCVGREAVFAQEPFPHALHVDPLDDRNFDRAGILPEIRQLADLVEVNCDDLRTLVGRLPTRETEAACLLPTALQEYTRALAAVAGGPPLDLDAIERRLRTGAILDGRRTRAEAARAAARYFLAKARLIRSLAATADLFAIWFRVDSDNFFRYVFPQVNSALTRGTRISPVLAFLQNASCDERPCGDPRLAPVLAFAARPVAMVRIANSDAINASSFLARSTFEPYTHVLRIEEALARLREIVADPRFDIRLVIEDNTDDLGVRSLVAAVVDLESQLKAAACWVSTPERQEALVWIDGRAAANTTSDEATLDTTALSAAPGTFLDEAGEEARAAAIEISDRLIRLRALLSPVGARP